MSAGLQADASNEIAPLEVAVATVDAPEVETPAFAAGTTASFEALPFPFPFPLSLLSDISAAEGGAVGGPTGGPERTVLVLVWAIAPSREESEDDGDAAAVFDSDDVRV